MKKEKREMAQVRDYSKLAKDIIREVGGDSNIINATRCATRLRLVLKETPKGVKEKISEMPGVITVVETGGQFQVVIGTHVGDVFAQVSKDLDLENNPRGEEKPKQGILNRVIATMSAVFAPFVYILAAAGILQGALILITMAAPSFADTGTYQILSLMSWTPFTFLPIFIAITASKHFECNVYIAVLCCCALVNPDLTGLANAVGDGEVIKFLFFNLSETTYTSSVLPPLFLVWILSYVERFVQKRLPDVIKPLFTPLICFIVMVPLTVLAIGPLSSIAAKGIANGYNFLFDVAPALAAAVIGGIWQVVVIFGVHWGITPVCLANFEMYGHDSFQAYQTIAVIAQMAAAFGVFIKTRNKEFKGVAFSAGVTGIFGITEPAIYGVTLRLKKPFICGCISGAVGAVVASLFGSLYYAYAGLPGLLTTVNAISPEAPMSFAGEAIGAVVAIVLAIVLVQIIGFEDPKSEKAEENTIEEKPVAAIAEGKKVIASPMNGTILPLDQVKDETFAQKVLGDGVAVIPSEGKVFAPADGTISALMDSYHAIGITCDNGVELLIHVGMDTVELKGKYFKPHIKTGDRVIKGTLLLEFDIPQIKKDGYEVTTPVIIANTDEFSQISCEGTGQIKAGADLISVE